jgi:CheY-like chemotaxis protein
LLDLHLPDRHGWDVLDWLRHDVRLGEVPVVVVSIDDPGEVPPHAVQGHLVKPFRAADLDRAVTAALGCGPA